ncbi:MAG: zinc-binding alcohol dehydrogenase, partial [Flavobacteriaceae bacterium]|nr:zinc-binding alcohol dehydrogenase [Flavobacteriaceae bacterium]
MKLKELPLSIYQSCYLALQPKRSLTCMDIKCVDVVVSLTTIPSRVHSIHLVIRSLLKQTVRPTKIVLW